MAKRSIAEYMRKFEALMPALASGFHEDDPACVAGLDVTLPQYCVLKVLYRNDGCMMKDLSASLGVTLGNMTSMIDRLSRDGFAARTKDPSDRRVVRVRLTARGKKVIEKALDRKRAKMGGMLRHISPSDIDSLLRIMTKLTDVIKARRKEVLG